MAENDDVTYSVSDNTVLFLVFILAALIILLFFLYKHLNKEANGKYTVQRIVFREGGLRDRVRGASVALGNRLGVQLWPQAERDQDEEDDENEEEEEEKQGQVHSMEDNSSDEEDDSVTIDKEQSQSEAGPSKMRDQNSGDGSGEENELLITLEPQEDPAEAQGPMVVNLNQFSGSVLWSEEDGEKNVCDITAL